MTICPRCNTTYAQGDTCSACGIALQNLDKVKRRGWVALFAGAFIVLLMGGVWVWVDRLLAGDAWQRDAATGAFAGRINVAFALVVVSGVIGIANGWMQASSGRRSLALSLAVIAVFAAAVFIAAGASALYNPS